MDLLQLLWFFLIGVFASGFSTVAGFGGGIVLLALGAFLADIKELIPISTAFFWALSVVQYASFRSEVDRKTAWLYLAGAAPGVVAGMAVYYVLPGSSVKLVLAVLVLAYCSNALFGWVKEQRPGSATTAGISLGTGVVDAVTASGGVIQAPLFLARGLRKEAFVATFALTSVLLNPVKVALYWWMGFFSISNLPLVGVLVVAGFIGVQIGKRLLKRISPELFKKLAVGFLVVVAVRMIVW